MEAKKGKYDTNPLDPEVARKTEEVWGDAGEQGDTRRIKGPTGPVGQSEGESARSNVYSEAPTRRIDSPPLDAPYPSVFIPPPYSPPAPYQSPANLYQQPSMSQRPTSRSVLGIGLPEKWAVMLPYTPFYIGIVVSLLELFLVPRKEVKVRFHAAQGLALHIAILLVSTLFSVVGAVTGSSVGGSLFRVAAFIFLIISMARVWKGEPHRIAPLAEPARWFNQHIEQRK
ncbi:MAG TPA: hypothetical protein VJ124_03470 [Pyrinomonadaceae bacterium]|nr:hypothetical protein [Pyrinomonadaceae bacterium]